MIVHKERILTSQKMANTFDGYGDLCFKHHRFRCFYFCYCHIFFYYNLIFATRMKKMKKKKKLDN